MARSGTELRESLRVLGLCRTLWYRFGYRPWAKLLHRLNLHHTRRSGPLEDGSVIHKCEWCGISRVAPIWEVQNRLPTRADLDALNPKFRSLIQPGEETP